MAARPARWYTVGMSETSGQVDGPEYGAADNAAANADPSVAGEILGQHAEDGLTAADRGLEEHHDHARPGSGDTHQPRTGAETPVDAEDLVRARGQDVTEATLRRAQEDLDRNGPAALEREVDELDDSVN